MANPNPSDPSPRRVLDAPAGASEAPPFEPFELELHGHRAVYRRAGNGPPVVLIHGMLNSSRHWEAVAARLSADYTVIAPDLLGHGDSATTQGDYSLGAHASGIRDVLSALGIDRATIVGHSLGGGVAMQFFYQFPERSERLVLISSGGLGREVSWPLRLTALPGAEALVALASSRVSLATLRWAAERLRARGAGGAANVRAAARALGELEGAGARRAFLEHPAVGDRRAGAARQRAGPALPRRGATDARHVGRTGPHDPGRARPRCARRRAGQPHGDPRARRPLPAPRGRGGGRVDAQPLPGVDRARTARRGRVARV